MRPTRARVDPRRLRASLGIDASQGVRVADTANRVFADTRHVHGLTKTSRPLLKAVALLHSSGNGVESAELERTESALREAVPQLTRGQSRVVRQALEFLRSGAGAPAVEGASSASGTGQQPLAADKACYENGKVVPRQIAVRLAAIVGLADALGRREAQAAEFVAAVDGGDALDLLLAGSPTASARAAVAEGAELWNLVMPKPIRSIQAHEAAPLRMGLLEPGLTVAEAARRVLLQQLEQFRARTYGLTYGEDIEYVHELRVALRRSRAALRVFREALNGARGDFQAELKWLAAELGEVRDLDVFLGFLDRYKAQAAKAHLPFLRALIASARRKRRRHYAALVEVFGSDRYRAFVDRFHPMLRAPVGSEDSFFLGDGRGQELIARRAPALLRRRLTKVLRYDRRLDRLKAEAQHELRIECKKLRYAAEFLADIYPGRLSAVTGPMSELQDVLGDVHDADAYRQRILDYCRRRRGPPGAQPVEEAATALVDRLGQLRQKALRQAAAAWRAFTRKTARSRVREMILSPREA
jgi:CHAD domain-containing protein